MKCHDKFLEIIENEQVELHNSIKEDISKVRKIISDLSKDNESLVEAKGTELRFQVPSKSDLKQVCQLLLQFSPSGQTQLSKKCANHFLKLAFYLVELKDVAECKISTWESENIDWKSRYDPGVAILWSKIEKTPNDLQRLLSGVQCR